MTSSLLALQWDCTGWSNSPPCTWPCIPWELWKKLRWLQAQQDRQKPLVQLKFSLSSHRAMGSAPTAHIWHTFHSTGTGNPTCQVCFALFCCPTFLWSQVLETYSPKEAMKAISLSRQDFQTNAAFYPLMEKQKPSEGLSVLLHLITGKSQVLHCIGSPI